MTSAAGEHCSRGSRSSALRSTAFLTPGGLGLLLVGRVLSGLTASISPAPRWWTFRRLVLDGVIAGVDGRRAAGLVFVAVVAVSSDTVLGSVRHAGARRLFHRSGSPGSTRARCGRNPCGRVKPLKPG